MRRKVTHSFGGLGIPKFIFTLEQERVSSMKQRGASWPTRVIDDEVAWLLLPNSGAPAKCWHPQLTWDVPNVECSCQAMGRGCMGVDRTHPRQGHDDFALEELQWSGLGSCLCTNLRKSSFQRPISTEQTACTLLLDSIQAWKNKPVSS